MVNNKIVSQYTGELPHNEGANRKIPGGPLYPAREVRAILEDYGDQVVNVWTRKCAQDMQKWALDADDLCQLMKLALTTGRYLDSEWCEQRPNGPWAACDAYLVVRREWIQSAHKDMNIRYYIKFAMNRTGGVLLVVSCHPPEDRR